MGWENLRKLECLLSNYNIYIYLLEESIIERLRRDVTACESIVKSLEINLKPKVEKSSLLPKKNRAAEFELILDS